MDVLQVEEVFTPTMPARKNFVERKIIDKRVLRALKTPGMQVVLYGLTGSGKTTLLVNKLSQKKYDFVRSNCTSGMTFQALLSDVYIKLGQPFDCKQLKSTHLSSEDSIGLKGTYSKNGDIDVVTTEQTKISEVDAFELSTARLLGSRGLKWVIEDFHKLDMEVRTKLSQMMKVFMDLSVEFPKLKIIALGAKNSAREVVELDPEMENRVSEIKVPLMRKEEIEQIVKKGCALLNVKVTPSTVEDIVKHSNGVASICHHLCLLMCESKDIDETDTFDQEITLDYDDFNYAVQEYREQESDTLKAAFQRVFKIKNAFKIVQSLAESNHDGLIFEEINDFIKNNYDAVHMKPSQIRSLLEQLTGRTNTNILIFDDNSDTYCFKDPFYKIFAGMFLKEKNLSKKMTNRDMEQFVNKVFRSLIMSYETSDESSNDMQGSEIGSSSFKTARYLEEDNERVSKKHMRAKSDLVKYIKNQ